MNKEIMTDYYRNNPKDILNEQLADDKPYHALIQKKIAAENALRSLISEEAYSKKFLEAHREEIELHKAAKAAFDEADLKKLPKVKDLNVEYSELLSQKKAAYPEYRKAKEEMQELVRAQKNVERFFAEEKQTHETEQVR